MRGLIKQTLLKLLAVAGLAAAVSSGQAQDIQVVGYTNTAWIYNDTSVATTNPTIAPGVSWRDPAYVPVLGPGINTWKTNGHGLFGNDTSTVYTNFFGTAGNGFRTPLDRTGGRITFYFITKFSWPFTTNGVVLRGTNLLDDGAVVYLNGVEVFRKRIGTVGVIPAWGATAENQANEGVPEPLEYAATSLVSGQNTLAVEVHQTSAGSSDVAFATALRAIIPKAPTNSTPNEPSDRTVLQNRPTTLAIAGDGQPNPAYQWYKDGTPIPGANTNSYAIALMQSTDAGLYYVVLANELGGYTSRVATVSYLADEVSPMVLRAIGSSTFTNVVIEFDELMDQANTEDGFGYGIDGGLAILSASRNPDGRTATLHTTPQAENTLYTVSVNSPSDLAGNVVVSTNVEFRSWVTTACGGVLFESFRNIGGGTAVSDLTSNPNYPNNPTEVYNLSRFDTRQVYPDDTHDNYGGRLRGVFIPPVSGNWVFYLRADDGVAFYLNPNGPSAAGKQLVQSRGGCCASFGANQTVPFPMIAGQAYFMETLYKEGGGGDYCAVAARLQGSTVPPDTESIPGTALGYGAIPAGALGTVSVTQSPADQTVQEHTASVTFSVVADSAAGAPICYQWQRSDASGPFTDIPGANRASVSVTLPTIANDNGDRSEERRVGKEC